MHNVANYSPPVFPLEETQMDEATIMLRLAALVGGAGFHADTAAIDDDYHASTAHLRA